MGHGDRRGRRFGVHRGVGFPRGHVADAVARSAVRAVVHRHRRPDRHLGGAAPAGERFLRPILDVMQSLPTTIYLVPAVLFFGIRQVPAAIATVLFAIAPLIRIAALGIREVPAASVEAGEDVRIVTTAAAVEDPSSPSCPGAGDGDQPDDHGRTVDGGDRCVRRCRRTWY